MQIPISKIMQVDLKTILGLRKNIDIVFEDGVVIHAFYKHIILFRYLLNFYKSSKVELTSDLWVEKHLVNGLFTNGTYLSIYSLVFRKVAKSSDRYMSNSSKLKLFKNMYVSIDLVNKYLVAEVAHYAIGSSLLDILDIQFEPKLMEAIHNVSIKNSKVSIDEAYNVLDEVMKLPKFNNNPVSLLYRSKMVSIGQMRQLLGPRGFVTEMDSKIFTIPMSNSFTLGFKGIYDAAIESRAGAKAMYLSSKAIQDAEYMARELQLATMTIENVHRGDCGKPTYVDFYVRPDEYNGNGELERKGDLTNLIGKRYKFKDNVERIIDGTEEHLVGEYIQLRMAVYCGLPDKHSICSACIGEIADSILDHQNLGHITSTSGSAGMSQALLSTKHLLTSAVTASIKLDPSVSKFMLVRNNEKLLFKAGVLGKKIKNIYLKFKQREAWGIDNIMNVKDIFSININKVSRLSSVILVIESKKESVEIELNLKYATRRAVFSIDMLSHIIKNGYSTLDEEYYMVDINNFDNKRPVFIYEKVEFDFAALIKEFKSMLKTRKYKNVNGRYKSEFGPHVLVQNLFELINNKLNVNIALLEVLTYAFTVQDLTNRNFDLGRNAKSRDVVAFREVIDYRSVGASFNWDNLLGKTLSPVTHVKENKCSTPMDVFFCPNEAIEDYKSKNK